METLQKGLMVLVRENICSCYKVSRKWTLFTLSLLVKPMLLESKPHMSQLSVNETYETLPIDFGVAIYFSLQNKPSHGTSIWQLFRHRCLTYIACLFASDPHLLSRRTTFLYSQINSKLLCCLPFSLFCLNQQNSPLLTAQKTDVFFF